MSEKMIINVISTFLGLHANDGTAVATFYTVANQNNRKISIITDENTKLMT
jgi:hypothetical protein